VYSVVLCDIVPFWFSSSSSFFFLDRVSLYSPGSPGTHFVDQAGLELRNREEFLSGLVKCRAHGKPEKKKQSHIGVCVKEYAQYTIDTSMKINKEEKKLGKVTSH
jgi:hypothetical protein